MCIIYIEIRILINKKEKTMSDKCCKVDSVMKVTASKKLADEVKEELEKKDKSIASCLSPSKEQEAND